VLSNKKYRHTIVVCGTICQLVYMIHDTVSWCLHYKILMVRVTILHNLLVLLMVRVTILHDLLVLHERELSLSEDLRRLHPAHYKALTTSVSKEAPTERQEL
jgi:hypothetical protein